MININSELVVEIPKNALHSENAIGLDNLLMNKTLIVFYKMESV